jgi:hypothetical protein
MIKIQYDAANGQAIPDGQVKAWVNDVIHRSKIGNGLDDVDRIISTESIINEFRIRVANGEIAPSDIQFTYDSGSTMFVVPIDKQGSFAVTPVGFCNFTTMQALELLRAMITDNGELDD